MANHSAHMDIPDKDKRKHGVPREGDLFAATIEDGNGETADDEYAACHFDQLFTRLARSAFRSRFRLGQNEREYVLSRGMSTIHRHAEDFIRRRLSPACIPNDGRQTPMRGHPVFIAQHATGCCCRGCMEKWHGIPKGRALTAKEQRYAVAVIMEWIRRQMEDTQTSATAHSMADTDRRNDMDKNI